MVDFITPEAIVYIRGRVVDLLDCFGAEAFRSYFAGMSDDELRAVLAGFHPTPRAVLFLDRGGMLSNIEWFANPSNGAGLTEMFQRLCPAIPA